MTTKRRIEKLEKASPERQQVLNWCDVLYGATPVYGAATPCKPFAELGRATP